MITSVCVFCGSRAGADPAYQYSAQALGERLGRAGITVVYGGGNVGLMGAHANAAMRAGGRVIGIIPKELLQREAGHRGITELVISEHMYDRKQKMIDMADSFVILPGGLGTLDELFEVITLRQLNYHSKPIIVVDVAGFWSRLMPLIEHVVATGFAEASILDLFKVVPDIDDVLPLLGVDDAA
ncbi:MAG: TIGR00730 family Rossman fold protein [Geminicoccaceae bacterium]